MIENVGALLLVLVVLLVLLNFTDNASQDILSVKYHHASLLEVPRASLHDSLVISNALQVIRIELE